jgi:hypothetical protein
MNKKTLRTLSLTGILASLFIAASPVWAHSEWRGHHHGYPPRHVYPYRPAVIVPPLVTYLQPPAPVHYVPPPAYVPARVHFRPPLRVIHRQEWRRLTLDRRS